MIGAVDTRSRGGISYILWMRKKNAGGFILIMVDALKTGWVIILIVVETRAHVSL